MFFLKSMTGNLFRNIFLLSIRLYQFFVSSITPPSCRFYPTCSEYSYLALKKYGVLKGLCLTIRRLLKCHPFHPGGYDPVP